MGKDRFSGISLLEETEKFNQQQAEQELMDPSIMSWRSIDRLRLKPFFTSDDIGDEQNLKSNPGQFPYTRGYKLDNNDWLIREDIKTSDLKEANLKAIEALSKGAESVSFKVKHIRSVDDFAILLDGIDETAVKIDFSSAKNTPQVVQFFIAHLELNGIDKSKVEVAFDYDPVSCLIKSGHFNDTKANDFYEIYEMMQLFDKELPFGKCVTVNTHHIHNAGATAVQEVAFGLAMVNEYLNHLASKGVSIDNIVKRIKFNWAIGSNMNVEIAKLRAIRSLWATMIKQYDPRDNSSYEMDIHCLSSNANKSLYNPYMNVVRSNNEAMAAVMGGCNSLSLATYDSLYKDSDTSAEAISRNIQLMLKNEANLGKVVDPTAGSYYVENMTNQIAYRAWRLFQEVESNGGFVSSMRSGLIKAEIDAVVDIRNMRFANREHLIVGTNHFAVSEEQLMDVDIDVYTSVHTQPTHNEITPPLSPFRGAKTFESLRLKSEQYALVKGASPIVYIMQMGVINNDSALAYNLFAIGGYQVLRSPIFRDKETAIGQTVARNAAITVISCDPEETDVITSTIDALGEGSLVVCTGKPKPETKKAMKDKGVLTFIHDETDVVSVLKYFHKELGIM